MNVGSMGARIGAVKQNSDESKSGQIALTYIVSTPVCHLHCEQVWSLQTSEWSTAKTKKSSN